MGVVFQETDGMRFSCYHNKSLSCPCRQHCCPLVAKYHADIIDNNFSKGQNPLYQFPRSKSTTWLASLWKGQVVPIEVFRAPGLISSRGGPSPCHRRRVATTTWLAETSWSSKIHLAESDRWGCSSPTNLGYTRLGGRQRTGMPGIKSPVRQRSVRSLKTVYFNLSHFQRIQCTCRPTLINYT